MSRAKQCRDLFDEVAEKSPRPPSCRNKRLDVHGWRPGWAPGTLQRAPSCTAGTLLDKETGLILKFPRDPLSRARAPREVQQQPYSRRFRAILQERCPTSAGRPETAADAVMAGGTRALAPAARS